MIRRAVHAVRKAVAHAIAFVAFVLDRSSRLVARVAGAIYPVARISVIPIRAPQPNEQPPRFTVLRWQGKRHWLLYDGTDGGKAKRAYETVERAKETGRMEFQMTEPKAPGGYVVRAVYEPIRG